MTSSLPGSFAVAATWTWSDFLPFYTKLAEATLTEETLKGWLAEWSDLANILSEIESRRYVATTINTADQEAEDALLQFVKTIDEPRKEWEQKLNLKLLESGLSFSEIEVPLKQVRAAVDLYREENIPRETQLVELGTEFDKLAGARSVTWKGEEVPLSTLDLPMESSDRAEREEAWRLAMERIQQDREPLNALWTKMRSIRMDIAKTADKASFVDYSYQLLDRFDYNAENVASFRQAILEKVVPAATKIYKRRAERLGLETLKPWDVDAPAYGAEPLRPYSEESDLIANSAALFARLDPQFEKWFLHMHQNQLFDLFGRKNKADGGYCTGFSQQKDAYIFMNAVGTHGDLQTLLHEAGHCFHAYEAFKLPYHLQTNVGSEFAEVASMGMEMLAQPHLDLFYSPEDAARAQIQHLEKNLLFWPYMAIVDAFQHWTYTSPDGGDAAACDAEWLRLAKLFMPAIDWSGLEEIQMTGWHRKLHIFQVPFYYVEYGLAQVGAMQVWANARSNEADAVRRYREGLALGCTVSLPDLFAAAGGRFAFDGETLGSLVESAETRIEELLAV